MKQAKQLIDSALTGKVVAVPESRQLDVLCNLFQRRGAEVVRVPLVAIEDAPDQKPVRAWLQDFIASPPAFFIILTGEGLRRLRAAAGRMQQEAEFIAALQATCKVCRGPKPGRVLKDMGLQVDVQAQIPTTAGIIATLATMKLAGTQVAVQLYGEDPNPTLMEFLQDRQLAECRVVAPYVYASDSDTELVKSLILDLAAGQIDLIAFTSQPQVRRLYDVARRYHLLEELQAGMAQTSVAAIGPVVAEALRAHACHVQVMPEKSFFMKPLVTATEQLFAAKSNGK